MELEINHTNKCSDLMLHDEEIVKKKDKKGFKKIKKEKSDSRSTIWLIFPDVN